MYCSQACSERQKISLLLSCSLPSKLPQAPEHHLSQGDSSPPQHHPRRVLRIAIKVRGLPLTRVEAFATSDSGGLKGGQRWTCPGSLAYTACPQRLLTHSGLGARAHPDTHSGQFWEAPALPLVTPGRKAIKVHSFVDQNVGGIFLMNHKCPFIQNTSLHSIMGKSLGCGAPVHVSAAEVPRQSLHS